LFIVLLNTKNLLIFFIEFKCSFHAYFIVKNSLASPFICVSPVLKKMSDVILILFAIILACTDVIFIYEIFYSLDRRLKKLEERRRIRGNPLGEGYYEEPPTYDSIALQVCKKLLFYFEKVSF
jgi:hypothetical protein